MLIAMAVLFVPLVFAGILSKIFISRFIERLEVELFNLVEEQRQAFRQLKQAKSDLKSVEKRRETAERERDELQATILRVQARISALTEISERRKEQARGRRAF
jgi:septal ring factor EnvC (AmiA/AmiB activator)